MISIRGSRQIQGIKRLHDGMIKLLSRKPMPPFAIQRLSSVSKICRSKLSGKTQQKWRLTDKVANDDILIYSSSLSKYVTLGYCISLAFIVIGITGVFYIIFQTNDTYLMTNSSAENNFSVLYESKLEILIFVGLQILFNSLLFRLVRMHVLRIWFHEKKNQYKLVLSNRPGSLKTIVLEPGTVVKKYENPSTVIGEITHYINGKTYHFNEANFKTPSDYHKFLDLYPKY